MEDDWSWPDRRQRILDDLWVYRREKERELAARKAVEIEPQTPIEVKMPTGMAQSRAKDEDVDEEDVDEDEDDEDEDEDDTRNFQEKHVATKSNKSTVKELIFEGLEMGVASAAIEIAATRVLMKMGADIDNPFALQMAKLMVVTGAKTALPMVGDQIPYSEIVERRVDLAIKGVATTGAHSLTMEVAGSVPAFYDMFRGLIGAMAIASPKEATEALVEERRRLDAETLSYREKQRVEGRP